MHGQLGPEYAQWGVTYSLSGTYKLQTHTLTIRLESGSAKIPSFRPEETNRFLSIQFGVCYYSNPVGRWQMYPLGRDPSAITLKDVILIKGGTYNFSPTEVNVPLPQQPLPWNNWLCSQLEGQLIGESRSGYYPAHDKSRQLVPSAASSASQSPPGLLIRIRNDSNANFRNVVVGGKKYGAIEAANTTDYQPWTVAYRYARITLETDSGPLAITPIDFVGERSYRRGHFTYVLTIQAGRLEIGFEPDEK